MEKLEPNKKEILLEYIYKYGFNYALSHYKEYPDDVYVVLSNTEKYELLNIEDSAAEVIGCGMLFEIVQNDYFDKELFPDKFDEYSFYDLLNHNLDYYEMTEAFDKGMNDSIKKKFGNDALKILYPDLFS